ncbi:type VII secretion protein EccB [Mycobacteroides salmoniphilum]|uniref:type VII secretion protein EccB n=1 Tax=Mycobacteroides salmoniphilum TaxID=404941 RepID=UPI0035693517
MATHRSAAQQKPLDDEISAAAQPVDDRSPLAAVTGEQVRAHSFLQRRNEAAIVENEVDMRDDAGQRETGFLLLSVFIGALLCVAFMVLAFLKPYGRVDQSPIVADGDHEAIYVFTADGKLHPAANLVSAQLVAGQPVKPAKVKAAVIAQYPPGPKVGIVDAPGALNIISGTESRWALCDTAPAASSDPTPTVTGLSGRLTLGGRADVLRTDTAVLAEHAGSNYVIWGGHRSRIDLKNRPLALALGIDSSAVPPVRMSKALFDAVPATESLETPQIPQAGEPARWPTGPGAVIGSILKVTGLGGSGDELYVLLADGIQKVEPFVAALLMSASPNGQVAPIAVSPKVRADVPPVSSLRVDYYPPRRLTLIDTRAYPVVCVAWSKGATDREAVVQLISGKGLPIPISEDSHLAKLVRNDRRPNSVEFNQTRIDPSAPNLVVTTSAAPGATSRETLWWIAPNGMRYGIEQDPDTLNGLGIKAADQAVQAPWAMIQGFGPGPGLSRQAALVAFDSISAPPVLEPVKPK